MKVTNMDRFKIIGLSNTSKTTTGQIWTRKYFTVIMKLATNICKLGTHVKIYENGYLIGEYYYNEHSGLIKVE